MEYKDKFIGYLDILGFKQLVEASESGGGVSLEQILEILGKFGSSERLQQIQLYGPIICPASTYLERHLDFQVDQDSDSLLVSSEISPAGMINLLYYCWCAVTELLDNGLMCRGYVTSGKIYHSNTNYLGPGYQEALSKEGNVTAFKSEADERGTPFVEVDQVVCNYVKNLQDGCVKEMFKRLVKGDGEFTVLFPFQRLAYSPVIGGIGQEFDPEKEKNFNNIMRNQIKNIKQRINSFVDPSKDDAVKKAKHYIQALDDQLENCDNTDAVIDMLKSPLGRIL